MERHPKVIETVVNNDLCIGCGLCVYKCPEKALEMQWNEEGFLVPQLNGNCEEDGACLSVCPFNPFPEEEVKTENELADKFLTETSQQHHRIGRYIGIYAGHAEEYRQTSSSGGLATYVFAELLDRGIVDHIFSVRESTDLGRHYQYTIIDSRKTLLESSKTKYFPVTLSTVFSKIHELDGKVAIVGVACFIKAIRLAQHTEPELKDKIPFLVGIICGGIKSRFFTEYLAHKAGAPVESYQRPEFRIKDTNSYALDYSFGCNVPDSEEQKRIKMRSVGDMWGTGLFKANPCDFCEDVATELADISLGDAWIPPYSADGKGTNVVVTRSHLAEDILQKGIAQGKLSLESISLERFMASQQGSFNHRQTGLPVRIKKAKKENKPVPPKRFAHEKVSLDFRYVQQIRMKVRKVSLQIWKEVRNSEDFDRKIAPYLLSLKRATKIYHYKRALDKRILKWMKRPWRPER